MELLICLVMFYLMIGIVCLCSFRQWLGTDETVTTKEALLLVFGWLYFAVWCLVQNDDTAR